MQSYPSLIYVVIFILSRQHSYLWETNAMVLSDNDHLFILDADFIFGAF